jgi:hypothetical protein
MPLRRPWRSGQYVQPQMNQENIPLVTDNTRSIDAIALQLVPGL